MRRGLAGAESRAGGRVGGCKSGIGAASRLKEEGLPMPAAAVLMSPITFMDTMEGTAYGDGGFWIISLAEDSFIISDVAELYAPGRIKRTHGCRLFTGSVGAAAYAAICGTDELLLTMPYILQEEPQGGKPGGTDSGDHMPHSWPIFIGDFPEAEAAVLKMGISSGCICRREEQRLMSACDTKERTGGLRWQ